ncbi:hypothetical protein [Steroidobacter cummioxidans]|uniref:AbiU2 domain-containing protein n=1 Tax=Steroidobacter cummioxidans TaxID=1803913 RepID=UPI000E311BE5|nr:hypothetical protein [Steroidobacter cummioxidans]
MIEYYRYLERLDQLVSFEVVPKLAIFDYFTVHAKKAGEIPDEVEPLQWYLISALYSDITFSIFRLFDTGGGRNIYHFLSHARDNLESIAWTEPLTPADIDRHDKILEDVFGAKENLRKRRNKFFGHYDKDYFYEPDLINESFPFSNDDAKALVRALQTIISDHKRALTGTGSISIDGFVYVAAEKLYKKLGRSIDEA